jgi:hypothetical protein
MSGIPRRRAEHLYWPIQQADCAAIVAALDGIHYVWMEFRQQVLRRVGRSARLVVTVLPDRPEIGSLGA